jgi:hypothetical protein
MIEVDVSEESRTFFLEFNTSREREDIGKM